MFYNKRELRRLWKVKVYEGDPNGNSDPPIRIETIVAWNAVDANRSVGGEVAKPPEPLFFVTWPEHEGGPIYRINSAKEGPVGDPIVPSVQQPEREGW